MIDPLGPDDALPRPSDSEPRLRDPAPAAPEPSVPTPPSLPDADEVERQGYRRLDVIKDNIEAFTVALVMALVIKHFCVEAFKIPTSSMWPTLYGKNDSPSKIGDRILVDKWAYLGASPSRWDVVVFRYPLNQAKHFIKRVGGVGGEWIKIVRGDLWTRATEDDAWRIATKPRRARDELYLPVYPPRRPGPGSWRHDKPMPAPDVFWEPAPRWSVDDYTTFTFAGGPTSGLVFQHRIGRESEPDDYEFDVARSALIVDVRVKLAVTPKAPGRFVLRWSTADDADCELQIAPEAEGASFVRTRRGDLDLRQPLSVHVVPGRRVEMELEYVDGRVWAHLDGTTFGPLDEVRDMDTGRDFEDYTQRLEIQASGGGFTVEDVQIDRDVHYVPRSLPGLGKAGGGVWVPEDHYFMLGDNTEGSSDSRLWQLEGKLLNDGREIWHENDHKDNPIRHLDDGSLSVVDRTGIERRWRREDVEETESRRESFVPRDLIVGRAFFIFWPVLPDFPGRAGFIH